MKIFVAYVEEDEAEGELAEFYEQTRQTFNGNVPDHMKLTSLRPGLGIAKEGMRQKLMGDASSVGARRGDLISAAVSGMNNCQYCGTAHAGGLVRRKDYSEDDAVKIFHDWRSVDLADDDRAMLEFAEKLNFTPSQITEDDVQKLRDVGFSDENIVDIVALTAYRNFTNRLHDGLGLSPDNMRARIGDDFVDRIAAPAKAAGG